jgi:alkylated DNA repair dioxygenase AlkB
MLSLFSSSESQNFLPYDGAVHYYPSFLAVAEASQFQRALEETIPWESDVVHIFGKTIPMRRKMAWFADGQRRYTYSGSAKFVNHWTPELLELKNRIEKQLNVTFNGCLLNYYHDGADGMGWHADDEKSIVPNSCIASISLGATRNFDFKHRKTGEKVRIPLLPGSLLVMEGETQQHWLHALPKALKIQAPRVNLTFRQMV